ncbi:lantibiotic dehydratase [Sphaerisporangium fuscum]|uniref:lantibiotic dehydratase n=1 Tax=Sphaerisporangium fuscum TaxID=2835868 RepID=UPI001BDD1578|nr:lantibiotic dehydratase [Sphaerisporangium fuscum]
MASDIQDRRADLVAIAGGWGLWRLAALRSAGLPCGLLDPLAPAQVSLPPGAARDEAVNAATGAAIDSLLSDPVVRTAMTWQNPRAVDNWIGRHVASLGRTGPVRRRKREALVARYVQRYCVKNDTIGFFGPVAWARLGESETRTSGDTTIRSSRVCFEVWAVEAVVRSWNRDPALRAHLPVRLDPACTLSDGAIWRPRRPPLACVEPMGRVIRALTPDVSLGNLVQRCGPESEQTVTELERQGVLKIGFRVPLDSAPEQHVRRQVATVTDPDVRRRLAEVLDGLERARDEVAAAGQDPERLRVALAEVDRRLAEATDGALGQERVAGRRTPLYLDCRRNLDATIASSLLDTLSGPLSVLLDSARWLAGQVGEVVEQELRRCYRELRTRRADVTMADLQFAAGELLSTGAKEIPDVLADFQLRWAEILPPGDRDLIVPEGHARELADRLFPASGRLWAAARVHSPDLLLWRTAEGDRWVLGELHVALNTLESRVFRTQADDPGELLRAVAADHPGGRIVPIYPNDSPAVSSRTYPPLALDPPGHYRYWSYGSDEGHPSGAPSTPATGLLVMERDGELVAVAEADRWAAPVLEVFGEFLSALVVNLFKIRAPGRHSFRAAIGDLTVCRRSWRVQAAQAPLRTRAVDPGHDRMRAYLSGLGVSRHVFARIPGQAKPFYADLRSPVLMDNLVRVLRTADHVDLVEMLPGPGELWLTDPAGRAYTSELRVVAVDPTPAPVVSWPAPRTGPA